MNIQVDSREKSKAIQDILDEFEREQVDYYISKLYVGDYMSLDNPRLVVDRKQNLLELCENVCQEHERFRRELIRAQDHSIHIIFLCEHGKDIKCLEDVMWWKNPRRYQRHYDAASHKWVTEKTKATSGDTLYKILSTISQKYDCRFLFCDKKETGRRIIEILSRNFEDLEV